MDIFPEQVVKHDKTAKNLFIKIIAVVLLFLVPMACLLLARVIAYFAMVGFFCFSAAFTSYGGSLNRRSMR